MCDISGCAREAETRGIGRERWFETRPSLLRGLAARRRPTLKRTGNVAGEGAVTPCAHSNILETAAARTSLHSSVRQGSIPSKSKERSRPSWSGVAPLAVVASSSSSPSPSSSSLSSSSLSFISPHSIRREPRPLSPSLSLSVSLSLPLSASLSASLSLFQLSSSPRRKPSLLEHARSRIEKQRAQEAGKELLLLFPSSMAGGKSSGGGNGGGSRKRKVRSSLFLFSDSLTPRCCRRCPRLICGAIG